MKSRATLYAFIFALIALSGNAFAVVKIKDVNLIKAKQGYAVIKFTGNVDKTPELSIRDRMIQISIPNSTVWPRIEKKATLAGKAFDTTLLAYQYDKGTARFRIMLPYSLKGKEDQVSLTLKNGKIDVYFPKLKAAKGSRSLALAKRSHRKKIPKKNITEYNEGYLEKLLKDKKVVQKVTSPIIANTAATRAVANEEKREDRVNMAFSGSNKEKESKFSLVGYIGKFVAFLALVLALFFGVMQLFKKGVLKKGKLGFLNSTAAVEVLSTTFIGPKRNLIMVRAHKQVFLLGASEKGIDLLSEIKDVSGLFKDGEKELAGINFDTSLDVAETEDKQFNLKEDITTETAKIEIQNANKEASLADLLEEGPVAEKVRFSDQIKNKVKNLKSLQ